MEVDAEGVQITGSGVLVVSDFLLGEEYGEHGTQAGNLHRNAGCIGGCFQRVCQFRIPFCQRGADIIFFHVCESRDTGCHGQRVAGKRAGLVHGAYGGDPVHDFPFAAVRRHRQTAADDFAQAGDVRLDVI